MTKLVKMSLVAAMAVSTLNAGSLEEAIKGVDISGSVSIGFNNYDATAGGVKVGTTGVATDNNGNVVRIADANDLGDRNEVEHDLYIKAVVPVNDNVKLTVSVENDYANNVDNTAVNTAAAERQLYIKETYFTYANGAATVMVGKQGVSTPWTSSVRGNGVVGMYNAGVVTLAAAHFENVTLAQTDSISAAAVIGSFGAVNASLWALQTSLGDGYSINANGKIMDMVSYDVRHTTFEGDGILVEEESLSKIVLGANLGPVALTLGYGQTSDNDRAPRGGVALNKDNGESADLYMDMARLDDYNDATAIVIGASIPVGAWTFGAVYLDAKSDDVNGVAVGAITADVEELNVTAKYAMSSNFNITALYTDNEVKVNDGAVTIDDTEQQRMELSLNYSF